MAVPRNHDRRVAFSLRKSHPAQHWQGHVNWRTALQQVVVLGEHDFALLAFGFFVGLVRCNGVVLGVADRILQLADGRLGLALDLLSGAFDLGPGVAGHVSYMTLCASHYFVDRAFDSVLIHLYPSMDQKSLQIASGHWQAMHVSRILLKAAWGAVYSNFRVAVTGADELQWLFPQEKATLLDLRCRTLTLELP